MKAGILNIKSITYTHINSDVPFPPVSSENGKNIWKAINIRDDILDVNITLDEKSFIGALSFKLEKDAIVKAEVYVDFILSGSYNAKTNTITGGDILIPLSMYGEKITLRLYGNYGDVILSNIEVLGLVEEDLPLLFPTPKKVSYGDDFVKIRDIKCSSTDADSSYASSFLKEEFALSGIEFSPDGVDLIIEKNTSSDFCGEKYSVSASKSEIRITASKRLSLLYGADTILKLYEKDKGLREIELTDEPTCSLRGFHMGLPMLHNFEFARRLFRYVLLPLRYNMVIVEFAGGMRFSRHPEISDAWEKGCEDGRNGIIPPFPHAKMGAEGHLLEKEDIKTFIGYVKELGLSFVPEIQSFAHVQYITYAHPEIAEVGKKNAELNAGEMRPDDYFSHCYCPSNEKSYEIIFDIIDEILEVTGKTEYIHIGHDEVWQMGLCPLCKGKNLADLFAYHVNKLYDYITKKGYKIMMWADMLHSIYPFSKDTFPALKKIPKDILLLDFVWYYSMSDAIEEEFLAEGFNVAIGNFYSSHFKNFKERSNKEGFVGGEVSTWVSTREDFYAHHGKFYDAIYSSEMLSNPDTYDERNRESYTKLINDYLQVKIRNKIRGYKEKVTEKTIALPKIKSDLPLDLAYLCPNAFILDKEIIEVNDFADRIIFNHATIYPSPRIPWQDGANLGSYVITFRDGETQDVPIEYGKNVLSYKTSYGSPNKATLLAHMGYIGTWNEIPDFLGKNQMGENISTFKYIFDNPFPEKKIKSISFKKNPDDYLHLVLKEAILVSEK